MTVTGRRRSSFSAIALLGVLALATSAADPAIGQTNLQRAQNLATCLTGKFPSLCKREWLTTEELRKADSAERHVNRPGFPGDSVT